MITLRTNELKALRGAFIDGMSKLAASVSIITTDGPYGKAGLTATSVTSVSADTPAPTLLVCVNRSGNSHAAILGNGNLCVNVLGEQHRNIADRFAGRGGVAGTERFTGAEWHTLATGAPVLSGTLAAFDCRITQVQTVGSHDVIFAELADIKTCDTDAPLVYSARHYATLCRAA